MSIAIVEVNGVEVKLSMEWEEVYATLTTIPHLPIQDRYRALFFTKQTAPTPELYADLLAKALLVETSILMRHEICYVLGQSGEPLAIPTLHAIMHDESEDEITRHEAAEGLAALNAADIINDLQRYEGKRLRTLHMNLQT